MKAKGVFICSKEGFIPLDHVAKAIHDRMAIGDKVMVQVHNARWPDHHRLAWAVFSHIGEATGYPKEVIATYLKIETGRYDCMKMPDGEVFPNPHSLSFESMDQKEFQRFWDESLPVIFEKIIPGISQEEADKIRHMIAGINPQ